VGGKTITLKVTYNNFSQITRSATLPVVTDDGKTIYRLGLDLLGKTEIGQKPIRLLGISLSQLAKPGDGQLFLFNPSNDSEKERRLNRALDAIQDKYGDQAIGPGSLTDC